MKVGDKIPTWFSGEPDGLSTILQITPYTGAFPQWFTHVARVTAPRTNRGWMEVLLGPNDVVSPVRSDIDPT